MNPKIWNARFFILAILSSLAALAGCGREDGAEFAAESVVDDPVESEVRDDFAELTPQVDLTDADVPESELDPELTTAASGSFAAPKKGDTFAYLINSGKAGNQSPSARVYFVDLFDTSASKVSALKGKGKTVICYFSAGSYENWRSDKGRFPKSALGRNLDGWAGEKWINYRDGTIRQIMAARIQKAKDKGCHGVDPDNIDGHTNSTGFSLSAKDQLDYFRFLSETAHKNGLSVGLKNSAETAKSLTKYADFAVIEECFKYGECGSYSGFKNANKAQFMIEYRSKSSSYCSKSKSYGAALIFADMDLTRFSYCQ